MTNCFGREDDDTLIPSENEARAEHDASHDARTRSIACLAHELNNLLTIAMGQLSALQMRVDTELAERHVDPAIRACRRGGDVARRLAELALHACVEPREIGDVPLLPQAASPDVAPASEYRDVVLIVGGDDGARAARRRDLVDEGFGVLEARDAGEAEALLAAIEEIGAVVLVTGDATTREAVDRAHGARPELAVVRVARAGDAPAVADGVVLPAAVSGAELARAIAHALASPRAR